jgi:MoaA/NifB/PqqE/SkfB family radical SAM enzyme
MSAAWIAFHVTDRCQLDCQHCLRDPELTPKDLPLSLMAKVMSEAKSIYRSAQVALTGGEPTLHPEFEGILDAIVANDFTWHLVTNGKRFPRLIEQIKAVPERRARLTAVNFSLDGATEATHDGIRGKGSFREVMLGATLCTAHGIPFLLQMVINAKNVSEIEALGMLASQVGANRVSYSMLQPTGTLHDAALYLSPSAWRDAQDRIERLGTMLRIPVGMPEGFYTEQPFHVCEPFKSQQLHVDVKGRLNLCCQHSGVPGDDTRSDVAGDLNEMTLIEAHRRLLGIIHQAQSDKLARMAKGPLTDWEHFPCNDCMKYFGKPHWEGQGAQGPEAQRERWRGAWAPTVKQGVPEAEGNSGAPRGPRQLPLVRG